MTEKIENEELVIDKQVNILDQFISEGGFDQAFQDVFGLPEPPKAKEKNCWVQLWINT